MEVFLCRAHNTESASPPEEMYIVHKPRQDKSSAVCAFCGGVTRGRCTGCKQVVGKGKHYDLPLCRPHGENGCHSLWHMQSLLGHARVDRPKKDRKKWDANRAKHMADAHAKVLALAPSPISSESSSSGSSSSGEESSGEESEQESEEEE